MEEIKIGTKRFLHVISKPYTKYVDQKKKVYSGINSAKAGR